VQEKRLAEHSYTGKMYVDSVGARRLGRVHGNIGKRKCWSYYY